MQQEQGKVPVPGNGAERTKEGLAEMGTEVPQVDITSKDKDEREKLKYEVAQEMGLECKDKLKAPRNS